MPDRQHPQGALDLPSLLAYLYQPVLPILKKIQISRTGTRRYGPSTGSACCLSLSLIPKNSLIPKFSLIVGGRGGGRRERERGQCWWSRSEASQAIPSPSASRDNVSLPVTATPFGKTVTT